jgi:DNA-repair protein XRCC2
LLERGHVIELQGPAGSGKTHLVYAAVATCILPSRYSSAVIGGWGQAAVVIDAEDSFDLLRLKQLLVAKIATGLPRGSYPQHGLDQESRDQVVHNALQNLHVFHPNSSTQLAATVTYLSQYLQEEPTLRHREIGLLVVDSLSCFYWQDRFTTEQLRGGRSSYSIDARTPFRHALSAIEEFRSHYFSTVLLTNWGLNPLVTSSLPSETSPFFKQHLYPMPSGFSSARLVTPDAPEEGTEDSRTTNTTLPHAEPMEISAHPITTFPLTHHVTLRQRYAPSGEGSKDLPERGHGPSGIVDVEALVRTRYSTVPSSFSFQIYDDHVSFEPSDVFNR